MRIKDILFWGAICVTTLSVIVPIWHADALVTSAGSPPNTAALPPQSGNSGKYLTTNGNTPSWGTVSGGSGSVTNIATTGPITGGPITTTGTIACATCGVTGNPLSQFAATTSAQLAGVISDETGSGALVFGTSPTFVTPALGTPASGVATNLTGTASGLTAGNVTTNANLTGVITSVGNATSIAVQTGTGTTFVTQASPTITTPTFTTSATGPLFIGGTTASSTLTLESTFGSGTTDAVIFKTGSQVEAARIPTGGGLGIGTTTLGTNAKLAVNGGATFGTYGGNATAAPSNGLLVSGQVGIGTATTSAPLEVYSNSGSDGLHIRNLSGGAFFFMYSTASASASLGAYNSNGAAFVPMIIGASRVDLNQIGETLTVNGSNGSSTLNASGNLSIGTTYVSSAAPTNGAIIQGNIGIGTSTAVTNLTVNGAAVLGTFLGVGSLTVPNATTPIQFNIGGSASLQILGTANAGDGFIVTANGNYINSENCYWNGSWNYQTSHACAQFQVVNNGSALINTAPSGTAGTGATMTTRVTVDVSGNVDIGTSTAVSGSILTLAGHIGYAPTNIPTVSSCGGGTLATGSTDNKGQITGITAATACTITFSSALPAAPACTFSTSTGIAAGGIPTTAAVTSAMALFTGTLGYICQ